MAQYERRGARSTPRRGGGGSGEGGGGEVARVRIRVTEQSLVTLIRTLTTPHWRRGGGKVARVRTRGAMQSLGTTSIWIPDSGNTFFTIRVYSIEDVVQFPIQVYLD